MKIIFDSSDPWPQYLSKLFELIKDNGPKHLCEIGVVAFPAISLQQIKRIES